MMDSAAKGAIKAGGMNPCDIDGGVFFGSDSMQHFTNAMPNEAIKLMKRLGIPSSTRQRALTNMGCCGGFQSLADCVAQARADPEFKGLTICWEATGTQHSARQRDMDDHDMLQLALFGDGAAAVVVTCQIPQQSIGNKLQVIDTLTDVIQGTEKYLSHSNHMEYVYSIVERDLPSEIQHAVPPLINAFLGKHGLHVKDVAFLLHPGGPKIVHDFVKCFDLCSEQIEHSWKVLENHGNMSGVTNLAVLHYYLHGPNVDKFEWALGIAFGPGICLQAILFRNPAWTQFEPVSSA
jgi:alkylresorcinol/alkylpyrone synthase